MQSKNLKGKLVWNIKALALTMLKVRNKFWIIKTKDKLQGYRVKNLGTHWYFSLPFLSLANFNQSWHQASLGEWSKFVQMKAILLLSGDNSKNALTILKNSPESLIKQTWQKASLDKGDTSFPRGSNSEINWQLALNLISYSPCRTACACTADKILRSFSSEPLANKPICEGD